MGVFDTIYFKCLDCGDDITCQSKSGLCEFGSFSSASVPVSVAMNANRHAPFICPTCGANYKFGNIPNGEVHISLRVERV